MHFYRRSASRDHIWTVQITQTLLGDPQPLGVAYDIPVIQICHHKQVGQPQDLKKQRHPSRKHIWTLQLTQEMLDAPEPLKLPRCTEVPLKACGNDMTQEMLDAPEPLKLPRCTEVPLKACGNHMTVLRRHGPPTAMES
ncbi:hypothetical protein D0Y65_021803 [Glycine soja]|uniref:Uncharacterized protein n=1 Tax=Glycine soja TaxID=3848 RepID=A0A445JL03_GLYSO|nr:hypothetical protein D0Y65_021803 [Glycine soja]